MMKRFTYVVMLSLVAQVAMAAETCPESTTAFVCTNPAGKIKLNRCATGNACYDKQDGKETLRCCPVKETSGNSKKVLLTLIKDGSEANLDQFKQACNFGSPIDFVGDNETHDTVKAALNDASLSLVRALIYANANCTDMSSGDQALRWLGNDILVKKPIRLIHALSYEEADPKKYQMSNIEKDEWYGTECQDEVCAKERKEYFIKKREALEKAKVPDNLEPIRKGLLRALRKDR